MSISPHGGSGGQSGVGSSTGDFEIWLKGGPIYRGLWEMDEGGSVDEAFLSVEAPWRRPQEGGGAPSLGTLEDMLRKSPDMGVPLHGGPFYQRGTWYVWGLKYRGP
jgi:hypothetical protein